MNDPQKLISWLKYLDIEFLDDELCVELSKLDINDPVDQETIIRVAILPEFMALNEISKKSMENILLEVERYPESDVIKILERVGMPFHDRLVDYKVFFRQVRACLFPSD